MRAQNTTPMMTPTWSHRGAVALAVLIALVVIGVGLLYAPSLFSRMAVGSTVRPVAHPLIANCRVCRDEALGAAQLSLPAAPQVRAAVPTVPATQPLIANCRVCRDEALGSPSSSLTTVDFAAPDVPPVYLRQSGPR